VEDPELDDPEPEGHVPPEQVAPIAVQFVHAAPLTPHAVSAVPLTQLPLTSQQPVQVGPHAAPLLPPLLESLPLSSPLLLPVPPLLPLPLLPLLPDDDPIDASLPTLASSEEPPSPLNNQPVPPLAQA